MYQLYENFIVWLLVWTPWDNGLRFNLEDGLEQTLEDLFWQAIAPNRDDGYRDRRRDEELQRVRILGIISRAKVCSRKYGVPFPVSGL